MQIANRLLELIKTPGRQLWIGNNPPFEMPLLDAENATGFRVSPALHQAWDTVWIYERFISDYDSWKLLLDEALRLFKGKGILVMRYKTNRYNFSNFGLKQFLFRRPNIRVRMLWEDGVQTDSGFISTSVFEINRLELEAYRSSAWTLGLITQGNKVSNVVQFCESVRAQDPEHRHEILIYGPPDPAFAPFNVRHIDMSGSAEEITLAMKKNTIADAASLPNLLVAHDRYVLDPGFFDAFSTWGYDFDLCAVTQRYENGRPYPAYCAMNGTGLVWNPPVHCENLNLLHSTQYVNGGLMVFKTHSLRRLRFNDLLYWNQAEDMELCHQFQECGLPPRMNFMASATTIGVAETHTAKFASDRTIGPFS